MIREMLVDSDGREYYELTRSDGTTLPIYHPVESGVALLAELTVFEAHALADAAYDAAKTPEAAHDAHLDLMQDWYQAVTQ